VFLYIMPFKFSHL